ncbi:MAG: orotate phosphoribosyltransferase [Candidatus Gracilibacteria bacterium]|jgi:orotate phosphoribosyltransferase
MENYPLSIAQDLLATGAFKISLDPLFTWTSGLRSPVYCDLRALISNVEARRNITEAFQKMYPGVAAADVIAGTATAGIPWAAWLAEALGKPMVYIRGAAKEHGTKKRIEGSLIPGQKVVLVEDHISTGGSSISAVEALRTEGQALVDTIVAINTYELQKSKDQFEAAGLTVFTLTNFTVILSAAKDLGLIDSEKEMILADFRNDPASWAEKHGL